MDNYDYWRTDYPAAWDKEQGPCEDCETDTHIDDAHKDFDNNHYCVECGDKYLGED